MPKKGGKGGKDEKGKGKGKDEPPDVSVQVPLRAAAQLAAGRANGLFCGAVQAHGLDGKGRTGRRQPRSASDSRVGASACR
jgi:hypothetical protein